MPADTRVLLERAVAEIRSVRARLNAAERAQREPVAIVGAGCRFPGGVRSLDDYWRLLRDGVDAVRVMPPSRWDAGAYGMTACEGGFLDEIETFDAGFFGVSPREAARIDPQQRLVLEVAWEAIEHAGIAATRLASSLTGVYVGVMTNDYLMRSAARLTEPDPHMVGGSEPSFIAGRLAYYLGLNGPAMAVATACSSSLVTVHLACQALRARECDLALAGGANVILDPIANILLSKLGALAPDGRCKSFDARADGYGRGEGCGMVVLERLSDAIENKRTIVAVIRGSAVNHDGASAGLTVPNGPAQEKLLRRALEIAGVSPRDVGYVEAHGTGTILGDPIEVGSLARVFGAGRTAPLLIGSVKTNFGHLEAAAGIAGLLKSALALRERQIPPQLHLRTPNTHIPWSEVPVEVVTSLCEWPSTGLRYAGVSSFGLSGVNAHVVLEEAPPVLREAEACADLPRLLTLSAKTAAALERKRTQFDAFLATQKDESWADICFTANTGRVEFEHRLDVVAGSIAEARVRLSKAQASTVVTEIDRDAPHRYEEHCRPVALPAYPFERERHWIFDHDETFVSDDAPAVDFAGAIAARVQSILKLSTPPDRGRSLVSLGLDSLMAVELRTWLRDAGGVEADLRALLSTVTIRDLAMACPASPAAEPAVSAPAAIGSVHRLSEGQKALWFIHASEPSNAAYNIGFAFRIRAAVDPMQLRNAFQRLSEHHGMLRATFTLVDGELRQEIHPSVPVSFETFGDWNDEVLRREYLRPFDLERGPVWRTVLFTRAADDHGLLFVLHHIVCDAVSCWTLLEELQQELREGAPRTILPSRTYADFVDAEERLLAGEEGERHWNYWKEQLGGDLPLLDLPVDFARPAVETTDGASLRVVIPENVTQTLRELARSANATLYVTLLAAFQLLLHRFSGQDEVIVGSATSSRPPGFDGVVGYFVNPLPIRTRFGDETFRELVASVRRTVFDALDHQSFPFPLLVQRLQPRREAGRSPIFQADFALSKSAVAYRPGVDGEPLPLEPLPLRSEEGQFELGLYIQEGEHELVATFKYDGAQFRPESVERMAEAFLVLLRTAAADSDRAADALPIVSDDARARLIALGTGPQVALPRALVHQRFEEQAARTPDAAAIIAGDVSLTYAQLDRRVNALARRLRRFGIGPETIVAVCIERSCELVVALLAILKAGGAYLPLDPTYPAARLEFMLRDSRASLVVTSSACEALVTADMPRLLVTAGDASEGPLPDAPLTRDSLAYVIYTSGSTGAPKGALLTHGGLLNYLSWAADAYRVSDGIGAPVHSAIGFDATITSLYTPLLTGGRVVLLPETDSIEALRDLLQSERGFSLLKITPVHLEILASLLEPDELRGRANALVIGGEALHGEALAPWRLHAPETRLINEYGPTETVVGCCTYEATEMAGAVPIGRPIANTTLLVLDTKRRLVPEGVAGELYIGGSGVARGYLDRPELTAERFVTVDGERFYRSGDIVRWRHDGNLEYRGRADDQVKIRGYRVEPGEIACVLAQHPDVTDALVVARVDSADAHLVAYYVSTRAVAAVELRHFLAERLPPSMVPSFFVALDALPLTPNGKVDRAALPAPATRCHPTFVAPRSRLEMQFAAVWEEVLHVRAVGIRDDFFELGGHSLLAVRLVSRLREVLDRDLPLGSIFRAPTIERLAALLGNDASASPLVPIQSVGKRTPFFCIPGAGGNVAYFYALGRALPADQPFFGVQGAGADGESLPHTRVESMAAHAFDAIRRMQPHGPYAVGGHSLGGLVAFELAQQFRRAGEDVALVVIIDTPSPHHADSTDRSDWDDARWIAELSFRIGNLLRPEVIIDAAQLRGMEGDAPLHAFREALVQADLYPAGADLTLLRHILRMYQAHSSAQYTMAVDTIRVPIALLRTAAAPPNLNVAASDPTWGWGALASSIDVEVLPGEHLSILRPPHVAALARALASRLESAPAAALALSGGTS